MKNGKLLILTLVLALGLVLVGCEVAEEPITAPDSDGTDSPAVVDEVAYPVIDFMSGLEFSGDWDSVPATEFVAFFPGQANWQWLTSSEHPGSGGLQGGMGCATCHAGKEKQMGESLVSGDNKFGREPEPIAGKDGYKVVTAQAAYDNDKFYLKVEYESERPGITHETFRFDGENWVRNSRNKAQSLGENEHFSYEDRFAVIIGDQNIPAYDGANIGLDQVGCWQTCHSSMRDMPLDVVGRYPADEIKDILGKSDPDVRKYLLTTRTELDEAGGWDKLKSQEELDVLLAEGNFLDLWQFRASRSGPVNYASDDYVFEYRNGDKGGKQMFFTQPNDPPQYMYDSAVTGFNAIPMEKFEEMIAETPMILGVNAVEFDPNADFQVGDILPRRVLQQPEGSKADVQTFSKWEDGKWTMIFVRDLDTGQPTDKVLADGNVYNIGFGVFDDYTTSRRHFVTLPMTLGLGAAADIEAVKID